MPKRYITIVLVYLLLLFSASIGIPVVQHILLSMTSMSTADAQTYGVITWSIFSNLLSLAIIIPMLYRKPKENKIELGEKTAPFLSIVWIIGGVIGLYVAQFICSIILTLISGNIGESANTELLVDLTRSAPIFLIFISVLGPILEELVFRKVVFGGLSNVMNIHVAAVISSLFFGLLHGDISFLLTYFVIGLILCFLYTKTKRIAVSMGAHILMNTIVLLVSLGIIGG
ncbi:TPA: CPBP family intramembrane glutamic endopeptidase [Listeria innocua]|uniref:Lin2176 protein n=1 Tax=Listeria innocua serovar 6a (strain ATCC BAA-680 / CLIP 11262) TaxID=272626 RepID=Q929U8_LISIN|nr:CPBP family intramembrane glutamic endopeptidase [Listeria innocua]ECC1681491.1 CPBP family intramembrane metalloprotease [Listeria innocua]EEQ0536370.1 CPBP family intramembrane metalloprotease [Listeria innocua]EHD9220160.1 CPBP family intramembrane metalloprotease [Listeria innocua]EHF3595236.1 CPBP family intramembrane metalloprotease [Listeria innocua]EHF3598199.1 CPBP family intramembrane metalloprotease [Listeria innocua]